MKDGWELYDENNPEHNDPSLYGVMEWSKVYMSDSRRPDYVNVGTIYDDAERRDFTINALYYNPFTAQVLDPTGKGVQDINNKLIRFNGSPKQRIEEDGLRVIRMYRFSALLGFEIDPIALKVARRHFDEIYRNLPPERVRLELEKLCGY